MREEIRHVRALLEAFIAGRPEAPRPPRGLRWDTAARLVLSHRLAAALGPLFVSSGAPDDLASVMEDHARAHRLRAAWMELELVRCLRALEAGGIRPVLLKGISLGKTVYPSAVQRFALDLDLLVRPERVDETCRLLEPLGYRGEPAARAAFYAAHHVHRILTGTTHLGVEVHWALSRRSAYHRLDPEWFLTGAEEIELDGLKTLVPSPGAQLLHAAAQAADEGFSDLRRVADAALLLRRGAGETSGLAERAHRAGLGPALWALVETVRDATGTEPPRPLAEALRPNASRRSCIRALRLADACISLSNRDRYGLCELVRMTCAPDASATARRIRRYVAPAAGDLSPSEELPVGPWRRLRYGAPFALSLVKMAAFLVWRLATRGRGGAN